jgi:hypothetical protein
LAGIYDKLVQNNWEQWSCHSVLESLPYVHGFKAEW